MTAKRFRFNGRTNCIEYDNESILLDSYGEDIEDLLNELHAEKEMWKRKAKWYKESLERNGFKVKCKELEE